MEPQLYFYSFRTGIIGTAKPEWILNDVKIPAYDIKQAIVLFFWLEWFRKKKMNPWKSNIDKVFAPDADWVSYFIRQVIEYEIASKSYCCRVNYRTKKVWNHHEFADFFAKK
ncbi:MAG: hypothetical protein IPG95_12165 [Saprospiraceae bacterium]|nr:hypothetical protein [Saprospiraceae bacterium]